MPEREVDFLIVGGGDAGFSAARTLREEGAEGSILIVSRDPDPPYDRTAVSKGYLGGEKSREDALLGGDDWFAENDVELLTRTSAMKLDTEAHTVTPRQQGRRHATASCCSPPARTSAACGSTAPTSRASTTCARSATPTASARTPRTPSTSCWSAAPTSPPRSRRR